MNYQDRNAWTHIGTGFSSEPFLIDGVDVWTLEWQAADTRQGRATVIDPNYGQTFQFPVYAFHHNGRDHVFAAGEFSNGVFGFYTPTPLYDREGLYGQRPGNNYQAATPPAVTGGLLVLPGWPTWGAVAPYAPLAIAMFSVPWIVLVAMMHIGGQGPARGNPNWKVAFMAECIAPAVIGLAISLVTVVVATPKSVLPWLVLIVGCIACAAVVVGMAVAG